MPHVVIYNLAPVDREEEHLEKIEGSIAQAVLEIKELNLSENDISFTFVDDSSVESETIPIVVIVELFVRQARAHA